MRIRFPTLRTLPSSTEVTPSFSPISRTSACLPLKAKEEVREATCTPGTLASALMISSVIPSLKYSFSGSALMLVSGRTAIALTGGVLFTDSGVLRRPSRTRSPSQGLGELGRGGEAVHRGPGQRPVHRLVHCLRDVARGSAPRGMGETNRLAMIA